jgi:phage protein U
MFYLGSIKLDVLRVRSLSGVGFGWEYSAQTTIESLPIQQLVGQKPSDLSLDIKLHPALGDHAQLEAALRASGDAGEVLSLQTESGVLLGYYVLASIGESWDWTLPDGTLLEGVLSLKLTQHRPPGDAQSPQLAVEGTAAAERVTPTQVDSSGDPAEVPLSQVVRSA